jgi:di/tricarboxylate transporter|tara:strand:+ start:2862 stop:3152 length:291 start_codon:yes stop_codon:yes gene_type:complete
MSAQTAQETAMLVARELEGQSLNAIVAGFSFAAALSWVDLVRWVVNQVVKVNKNGGMNYTLTAVMTTLLSIVVYLITSRLSTKVNKPTQPIFAVTK